MTKALAEQIKQVMELDAKRTQGKWYNCKRIYDGETIGWHISGDKHGSLNPICESNDYHIHSHSEMDGDSDFIASAPLMADIIRQLTDIIRVQHEALDVIRDDFVEYWYGESGKSAELASIDKADRALALSAPIVNMKKGG